MKLSMPETYQLTRKQQELVNQKLDERNPYLLVKGYGGSGKTVVAYHRALNIKNTNKKGLFLCYGKALRTLVGNTKLGNDIVKNIDKFYGEIHGKLIEHMRYTNRMFICARDGLNRENLSFQQQKEIDNVAENMPMDFDGGYFEVYEKDKNKDRSYLCYIKNNQKINEGKGYTNTQKKEFLKILFNWYKSIHGLYDEIIIDEAQDLSSDFLESVKILTTTISIFFDENQIIFSGKGTELNSMQSIFGISAIELKEIKRCPKEIVEFSAENFLPAEESEKLLERNKNNISCPGSYPEILSFNEEDERKTAILNKLKQGSSLILLSSIEMVDSMYDFLESRGIGNVGKYHSKEKNVDLNKQHIITTYESAKGLEADIVFVVINKEDYENRRNAPKGSKEENQFYVLSSRAKKQLYIIFTYKDESSGSIENEYGIDSYMEDEYMYGIDDNTEDEDMDLPF